MYIKDIQGYDGYTANFVVTDGVCELLCFCLGRHDGLERFEPKIGTRISKIYAESLVGVKPYKVAEGTKYEWSILKGKHPLEYKLRGKVLDTKKALVKIEGFVISLENDFEEGLPNNFVNGDSIEFMADRLDATIDLT